MSASRESFNFNRPNLYLLEVCTASASTYMNHRDKNLSACATFRSELSILDVSGTTRRPSTEVGVKEAWL